MALLDPERAPEKWALNAKVTFVTGICWENLTPPFPVLSWADGKKLLSFPPLLGCPCKPCDHDCECHYVVDQLSRDERTLGEHKAVRCLNSFSVLV